ncbi:hypothetical protein BELL_0073g00010 [Botrytis elliptica]|uniref:Uncharacterized protein n=1 Tax=Botrytis elliptica TaxID=278938 RepID=A0A4Z1KA03_9HELO|nr:hypothetical protein BELL_0073g00010 [Botrytis elliptica]
MSSYTFSRASSDSSSSSSSSSSSFQSSYSMEPRVEVMRCSRCAKTVETISTMQYQGNELRRVSTDDASANGMRLRRYGIGTWMDVKIDASGWFGVQGILLGKKPMGKD